MLLHRVLTLYDSPLAGECAAVILESSPNAKRALCSDPEIRCTVRS